MKKVHIYFRHVNTAFLDPANRPPWPVYRPSWFDSEACFYSLLATITKQNLPIEFDLTVMFDGDETTFKQDYMAKFFSQFKDEIRINAQLVLFKGGSDKQSFSYTLDYIASKNYPEEDWIYLLEDDYLHVDNWVEKFSSLIEGKSGSNYKPELNYVTLYDHADKYFHRYYADLTSQLYFIESHHWRTTPSTCSTFLVRVKHLLEDTQIIKVSLYDYYYFKDLREQKGRTVLSPILGLSTHCSVGFISPGIDWEKENCRALAYRDGLMKDYLDRTLPMSLEYTGEFGSELVLFLPFIHWLANEGLLKDREVITYRGMRCFYSELRCKSIIEKNTSRTYIMPKYRPEYLPEKNEHDFEGRGKSPQYLYPDLRKQFGSLPMLPQIGSEEKPLIIVHNKFTDEWSMGAVNQIDIGTLRSLFEMLQKEFTIVYIRHGMYDEESDIVPDHNTYLPFGDKELLDEFPDVLCFDDLYRVYCERAGLETMNSFKNILYSRCYRFISSQGGGSYQMALYSGSLLIIMNKRGDEERWAYKEGLYHFMSSMPPKLAICRTQEDLIGAADLLIDSKVINGTISIDSQKEGLLERYSPLTIESR